MNIDVQALKAIETEKGISVQVLLETIASALMHAYREYKDAPPAPNTQARVDIDIATGAVAVIISELDDEGNVVQEHDDTPANFERIGTVAVRDAIVKRLREAETRQAYDAYSEYEGRVVSGVVQADIHANERGIVVVHLGTEADGQDGILLPAEQIPGEQLKHGDRVKSFVVGVNHNSHSLSINLSRTHPELVRRLFELEIPEVAVKGLNAKGACIGPRGQRVTNIMKELNGEKIDIIDYSDNPAEYVGNALAPSKVVDVEIIDATAQTARVTVPHYQLSLAIGKEGQNARLAARLTGWKIDIRSDAA